LFFFFFFFSPFSSSSSSSFSSSSFFFFYFYGSAVFLLDLGNFFSFLIPYTGCTTPWKGDQPVAR
jgi:hypothetical protein